MTIGFHSPMPPARTGVADYAGTLLGALRQHARVTVGAESADVHLYHLGNNQLHRGVYERALARPGVIVLHDVNLHHFMLGYLDRRAYVEEFVYNYGEWYRSLAEDLWRGRAGSGADARYFEFPMLRRVLERSRAVIVHTPCKLPGAHAVIPHFFAPPPLPPQYEVIRARLKMGVPQHTFLFGVFGHLRESKRLPVVLRAFEQARNAHAAIALLIAGEFASSDLASAIEPLLQRKGVLRAGYTPEREFWRLAMTVDACINLRYPTSGEASGIGIRLMGLGKPLIVTGGAETSAFPPGSCLRLNTGPDEADLLSEYMVWLSRCPESGREIGRRAAAHIAANHSLDRVARMFLDVLGGGARSQRAAATLVSPQSTPPD